MIIYPPPVSYGKIRSSRRGMVTFPTTKRGTQMKQTKYQIARQNINFAVLQQKHTVETLAIANPMVSQ